MTFLQLMVPYRGFNTWLRPRSTVRPLGPRSSSSSAVTVRLVSAWPEPSNYLWKTTFEIYQMVYSQNSFNCLFKCYQLVTQTIEILLASLRLCLFVQIWHIYTHLSFRITSTIIIAHWPTGIIISNSIEANWGHGERLRDLSPFQRFSKVTFWSQIDDHRSLSGKTPQHLDKQQTFTNYLCWDIIKWYIIWD